MIRIYRLADTFPPFGRPLREENLARWLEENIGEIEAVNRDVPVELMELHAPMENQEIRAAGFTYLRSREACAGAGSSPGGERAWGIFGYTISNDLSSRDIVGGNPPYLPQAKVCRKCCALRSCLTVMDSLGANTGIELIIERKEEIAFQGKTRLSQMKRSFEELADFLFRDNVFPNEAYLLMGAGIVPGNEFTLQSGDRISIRVDGLGRLENLVE